MQSTKELTLHLDRNNHCKYTKVITKKMCGEPVGELYLIAVNDGFKIFFKLCSKHRKEFVETLSIKKNKNIRPFNNEIDQEELDHLLSVQTQQ